MSSLANTALPQVAPPTTRQAQWIPLAWFSGLLALCYAPVLYRLILQWNSDEDMGHAFFVPIIAGYIAWQRREKVMEGPFVPNYWGLALVLYAAFQLTIATLGAEIFLARTAFLISIVGTVLFLGGTRVLKILAFPLALLIFMIPIPRMIYAQITLPLQLFASAVAEHSLDWFGIPVLREGNVLKLASQDLSVVEACSGIRSLLSLSFLGLVYAFFFDKRVWMRWVLLGLTIPIAIVANASRVTLTGVLSEINPEWAHGFFHSASGWVIFMFALALLVICHQVLMLGGKLFTRSHDGPVAV